MISVPLPIPIADSVQKNEPEIIQKSKVVTGMAMQVIQIKIWCRILILLLRERIPLQKVFPTLVKLFVYAKTSRGGEAVKKYVKKGDTIYISTYFAPFPSKQFDVSIQKELQVLLYGEKVPDPVHMAFLSITKKCPLKCEHCFEWDIMHAPEKLSLTQLKGIITDLQKHDLTELYLTGGEPLRRYNDLIELVKFSAVKQKVWVLSSGFGFTLEKAQELKAAGLTGMVFSLDHFEEEMHDNFRGKKGVYNAVMNAVHYAKEAGLIVTISLVFNKDLISKSFVQEYMFLAKSLQVDFVQWLEPRANGKYKNRDVALRPEQIDVVEQLFTSYNGNTELDDFPPILYQNYLQRRKGCNGSYRFFYIDSDGMIQACPFCTKKIGNALEGLDSVKPATCEPYQLNSNQN